MRNTLIISEVAMLAFGLVLVWFGSQALQTPPAPEAGRMIADAMVLSEVVEKAIAESEALRGAGEIEEVYRPLDP